MKSRRIIETPQTYLLVFDRGDEVISTLTAFARESRTGVAHFHALGAFERATIAYWNRETRLYEEIAIDEQVEVLSLAGDIASDETGKPRIHAHVSLGKRDGSMAGGHFMRGIVYPTLELFLTQGDTEVRRRVDGETGLSLIAL